MNINLTRIQDKKQIVDILPLLKQGDSYGG